MLELTVNICSSHLGWVLAMTQFMDLLVYIPDASMERWTRKELMRASVSIDHGHAARGYLSYPCC
jgi:hypothetical protein